MDYAGPLNGYYYLVIADSYSKWPEVFKYKHPTATNMIRAINDAFSRLGVPITIVSDNGTMFTGSEFKVYCDSLAIEHITCRNFVKELVILFHRTAAALWGHVVSIIKKSSTGDSSFFPLPPLLTTGPFVAVLDGNVFGTFFHQPGPKSDERTC